MIGMGESESQIEESRSRCEMPSRGNNCQRRMIILTRITITDYGLHIAVLNY